jgi:hypothetical protein
MSKSCVVSSIGDSYQAQVQLKAQKTPEQMGVCSSSSDVCLSGTHIILAPQVGIHLLMISICPYFIGICYNEIDTQKSLHFQTSLTDHIEGLILGQLGLQNLPTPTPTPLFL